MFLHLFIYLFCFSFLHGLWGCIVWSFIVCTHVRYVFSNKGQSQMECLRNRKGKIMEVECIQNSGKYNRWVKWWVQVLFSRGYLFCLFIYLFIYLFIVFIYLFVHLFIYLFIFLSSLVGIKTMPSPGVEPGLPKPQSGVLPLYYKGLHLYKNISVYRLRKFIVCD